MDNNYCMLWLAGIQAWLPNLASDSVAGNSAIINKTEFHPCPSTPSFWHPEFDRLIAVIWLNPKKCRFALHGLPVQCDTVA